MGEKQGIQYDRNGIKICDKPCESMFDFEFDDTLVEQMVKESESKLKEDAIVPDGSNT
jgi:hypothetical protein